MTLTSSDVEDLRRNFAGVIIDPRHADYDGARTIFNAMIDRRPALIAQCASTPDVQAAIRFARDHDLRIAIRGGGHSVAGNALIDGGLVIDLRRMHSVAVNPVARVVTVGGGATMGHLDRGTQPFGLATTGGRVSSTGVGGFTLGGGSGWLDRKFGLASDNLVAAEIVTADGDLLVASKSDHPELFWGLHGGGGNFGVATSLQLQLHALADFTGGLLLFAPEKAPHVLRVYRDFMEASADEVGGGALFITGPDAEFVPERLRGTFVLALVVVFAGPEGEARKSLAPLLLLPRDGGFFGQMAYADFQCMFDDPPGNRNYWSVEHLREFPDPAVDAFCDGAKRMLVPSPSQHVMFAAGGKVARETADWPVPWRAAPWCFHPFGLWKNPDEDAEVLAWAREGRADLAPWATGDVYLNFIGEEGQERVVAGFGRNNYSRLSKIKAKYDPQNVFRANHNIRPAATAKLAEVAAHTSARGVGV